MVAVRLISAACAADNHIEAKLEKRSLPALVSATAGITVQTVAEELVLIAASVGCGTIIARFALAQLFRAAGIGRRDTPEKPR